MVWHSFTRMLDHFYLACFSKYFVLKAEHQLLKPPTAIKRGKNFPFHLAKCIFHTDNKILIYQILLQQSSCIGIIRIIDYCLNNTYIA